MECTSSSVTQKALYNHYNASPKPPTLVTQPRQTRQTLDACREWAERCLILVSSAQKPKGPQMSRLKASETLRSNLAQWKQSLSTKTIMDRYGLPLLQTIATLAGTRSCLLVYLSLFALLWSETPCSAQRNEMAQRLELCPLHFIEVGFSRTRFSTSITQCSSQWSLTRNLQIVNDTQ